MDSARDNDRKKVDIKVEVTGSQTAVAEYSQWRDKHVKKALEEKAARDIQTVLAASASSEKEAQELKELSTLTDEQKKEFLELRKSQVSIEQEIVSFKKAEESAALLRFFQAANAAKPNKDQIEEAVKLTAAVDKKIRNLSEAAAKQRKQFNSWEEKNVTGKKLQNSFFQDAINTEQEISSTVQKEVDKTSKVLSVISSLLK